MATLPVLQHEWKTAPVMGSDFVPFETPRHVFSNDAQLFANEVTGMLIQIHQIAIVLTDEIGKFNQSRCWTDQDEHIDLVFKPEHFVASVRYFNLICEEAIDSIEALDGRLSAKPWLMSDAITNPPHDLRAMLAITKEVHQEAQYAEQNLVINMGLSNSQCAALDDINKPELHAVPAASPREIRFWVTWNTKTRLRRLSNEIDSGNVMEFYHELEASLINENSRDSPYPLRKPLPGKQMLKDKKKSRLFNPMTYFFCLGVDSAGSRVHEMIHIGATQERLQPWAAFWRIRRDSRLVRTGGDAERWANFFSGLIHVERHILAKTNPRLELNAFRTQIMEWRLGLRANPPAGTDSEDYRHIPVLRSCGGHVGQSFQPQDEGPVPCCLACKLSIGYKECTDPEITQSADFNLPGRAKTAWSCAEVISSKYCAVKTSVSSSKDSQ
ncbi:uncharacterized protein NECHADRAFT_79953 [Fusarium vanettenii 77-13-4]|uniref:Uncharacterized protein n=1 Tax=Fusarium vanettenii (strain ATCC MYA-4622 / CBS 123669 / FGSC 9596 / NRRL 45880 / 77-13-4) TaxID=660122 RepID=C7Z0N3_FUSV7|nr:uncharacterized protein NECHADRAFT_79953 [Fusarium vanettenii 77-13-4]EEU42412.1 predicted protein [Fusarium vanettenii 77-13-4]